jgi:hypothetical protein
MSHYFSQMYNTGQMWRDRKDALTKADGEIAKTLRNEFVVDHCRAVWLPLALQGFVIECVRQWLSQGRLQTAKNVLGLQGTQTFNQFAGSIGKSVINHNRSEPFLKQCVGLVPKLFQACGHYCKTIDFNRLI